MGIRESTKGRGGEGAGSGEEPGQKEAKEKMEVEEGLQGREKVEKVTTMRGWHQNKKENGPYTNTAKDFFKKCINPVVNCLENHCNGDAEAFAKKYPDFAHSSFAKKCCKGKGNSCSL